jgi:hypothetical protein
MENKITVTAATITIQTSYNKELVKEMHRSYRTAAYDAGNKIWTITRGSNDNQGFIDYIVKLTGAKLVDMTVAVETVDAEPVEINKYEIVKIIRKYHLSVNFKNQIIGDFETYGTPANEEIEFVKANKEAFIAEIKAIEKEENDRLQEKWRIEKESKVKFYVVGYEAHQVSIDKRLPLEKQFKSIAEKYENDGITVDIVKTDYEKASAAKIKKQADEDKIFETAKSTGKKQLIRSYMTDCNDPKADCSSDYVSVWAMPDGTVKTERTHTY